jgi:flagellar biosynthesis protein FlhB
MAGEDSGEKTFAPTEKRKRDAAQNGDVLRSRELGTAVGVFTAIGWLWLAGPWFWPNWARSHGQAFRGTATPSTISTRPSAWARR